MEDVFRIHPAVEHANSTEGRIARFASIALLARREDP